jgi:hypothetical protein
MKSCKRCCPNKKAGNFSFYEKFPAFKFLIVAGTVMLLHNDFNRFNISGIYCFCKVYARADFPAAFIGQVPFGGMRSFAQV